MITSDSLSRYLEANLVNACQALSGLQMKGPADRQSTAITINYFYCARRHESSKSDDYSLPLQVSRHSANTDGDPPCPAVLLISPARSARQRAGKGAQSQTKSSAQGLGFATAAFYKCPLSQKKHNVTVLRYWKISSQHLKKRKSLLQKLVNATCLICPLIF